MLKKLFYISVAAAVSLAASSVHAQSFNSAQFLGIDRDADNMISRQEAAAFRLRYFSVLDQNEDGSVEFEEYVQANQLRSSVAAKDAPVPVPAEYKRADKNKDTILTKEEFLAVGIEKFAGLDTNKDNAISQDEFVSPGL